MISTRELTVEKTSGKEAAFNRFGSILLLIGSFMFAYLLGEAVHELGHYLAHQAVGNSGVQIHLDPFGGSRIEGVTSLSKYIGFTSAAGPLFNLILGISFLLLLWRMRTPTLLPFLLWGPVAMVQEGVAFSLGLMTPGGDAQWIIAWGVPQLILLIAGVLLLGAGTTLVSRLMPVVGLGKQISFREKFIVVMAGISSLMLLRLFHSLIFSPSSTMENLIPLVFSMLLAVLVVQLDKSFPPLSSQETKQETSEVSWIAAMFAMTLGVVMLVIQVLGWN